jgi:MarC family membrane protein
MSLWSAAILLFLVIDPVGNVPFFAASLQGVAPQRHRTVVVRELVVALAVMVGFLFLGQPLLRLLGISGAALTIAGGVVLFLIALRMVFPAPGRGHGEEIEGEPFIVPLAIPYVAGPSVLATELLLISREPAEWPKWLAAIALAWGATAVIVLAGAALGGRLGRRGLVAVERLMGMVLVAIAVQMFLSGVALYLGELPR